METYLTQLFISPIYSLDPYFFIVYENIIYSKINDLFYFKLVKHKQNQKTINEIEKEPPTKMGQKQYGLLQIQKILRKKMWSFQRGPIHPFSGFLHMHLSNPWHPDNSVIACKKKNCWSGELFYIMTERYMLQLPMEYRKVSKLSVLSWARKKNLPVMQKMWIYIF